MGDERVLASQFGWAGECGLQVGFWSAVRYFLPLFCGNSVGRSTGGRHWSLVVFGVVASGTNRTLPGDRTGWWPALTATKQGWREGRGREGGRKEPSLPFGRRIENVLA